MHDDFEFRNVLPNCLDRSLWQCFFEEPGGFATLSKHLFSLQHSFPGNRSFAMKAEHTVTVDMPDIADKYAQLTNICGISFGIQKLEKQM